jgi:glucose-1-phosphate cytidylyltransferase
MKVILLAGGLGTRISEETDTKPKPMVLIGDKPILWHLMQTFAQQGLSDFVIALGYKHEVIETWLSELQDVARIEDASDFQIDQSGPSKWRVMGLNTGEDTQTGGRISQCMKAFPGEAFIATYGDGLADVSIPDLLQFHKSHGKLATVTAVRPPARFGHLNIHNGQVVHFGEKNQSDEGWINGGYFVLEPEVAEYVYGDDEPFEVGALPRLAEIGQLMAYHHEGFWKPMDTLRDKVELSRLAESATPPWNMHK